MKKERKSWPVTIVKALLIICLGLLIFSCGGLKDPFKAPDLKGEELEDFLDSPIKYSPTFHNDHIREIFYAPGPKEGMKILMPRKIGTEKSTRHYAVIIEQKESSENSTVLFFEGNPVTARSNVYEYTFTKLQQGEKTRYQHGMNPILLDIYPIGYFEQTAKDIEVYNEGEPQRQAERNERLERDMYAITHPYEYIKNSSLILRPGIDDVRASVGDVFYVENVPEGISIEEPYQSGKMYIVPITIKGNSDVVKTSVYLDYDETNRISLVDRIVMAGNKETQMATTFEEKYQVILMLLSAMRGN
jgi:hypothetical protein